MGRRSGDPKGDRSGVSTSGEGKGKGTRLAAAGRRREWTGPLVNPAVWRASTILFDTVAELKAAKPEFAQFQYGRNGTPTSWALAEALTEMEPGAGCRRSIIGGLCASLTSM